MDKKIKNIIFDFGGVIVDLNKQATIDAFLSLGFDASSYIRDYVQEGPFAQLELGEKSREDFCADISGLAMHPLMEKDICDAWNRMLVGIPVRRLRAIRMLRAKYRVFLLSNTNEVHWEYACKALFPYHGWQVSDYFEQVYLSYDLHLMKPDEAFFRFVLEQENLCPGETLFIDDSAANCAAARAMGIQVFHSKRADDWLSLF